MMRPRRRRRRREPQPAREVRLSASEPNAATSSDHDQLGGGGGHRSPRGRRVRGPAAEALGTAGRARRPGVARRRRHPATEATLRDELVALARESAELSWRQMRRGVDELDAYTRPIDAPRGVLAPPALPGEAMTATTSVSDRRRHRPAGRHGRDRPAPRARSTGGSARSTTSCASRWRGRSRGTPEALPPADRVRLPSRGARDAVGGRGRAGIRDRADAQHVAGRRRRPRRVRRAPRRSTPCSGGSASCRR